MQKKFCIFIALFACAITAKALEPHHESIISLIRQMTVEEKISQLAAHETVPIDRLGLYKFNWYNEGTHGLLLNDQSTIFPHSIALAAMWDSDLMHTVASAISDEARIAYRLKLIDIVGPFEVGLNFFSPNINIARDPRWGRCQETYGEDPYLTSRMAVAYIKGMQGDDPQYLKTIAAPKHFAVHSGPEANRHSFNANVSQKDLWETYLPAFHAAITEGKAEAVMTAYSATNGVPATLNSLFITKILRGQWGYDGYVVSDYGAIGFAHGSHNYSSSETEAAATALLAGCDMENGTSFQNCLLPALNEQLIKESDIDTALYRSLRAKFRLGLFDPPEACKYNSLPDSLINSYTHAMISRKAAREGMVLLKNKNRTLPISKNTKILLTGPFADQSDIFGGSYAGIKSNRKSVKRELEQIAPTAGLINFLPTSYTTEYPSVPMTSKNITTPDGSPGFYAEYFKNMDLAGETAYTKIDTAINFSWHDAAPFSGMPRDTFSVRWSGYLKVDTSDIYTFHLESDDGIRLYVNDELVLNQWWSSAGHYDTKALKLNKDSVYKIVCEYFEDFGDANALLEFGDRNTSDSAKIERLKRAADSADVIVFCGGISSCLEAESFDIDIEGFYQGDRTTITLPTVQERCLSELKKIGKPIIMLVFSGSAITLDTAGIAAALEVWYSGDQGVSALADLLYGDYSPCGHLPLTVYKSDEDLPDFTDYSMQNRTYRYFKGDVLYPFGYGLSYSDFEYSNLTLDKTALQESDSIHASLEVKNIGNYTAKDVIQLYLAKPNSTNYDAIKQLVAFKKIELAPDETTKVEFTLPARQFTYYDTLLQRYQVEPGIYTLMHGKDSRDIRSSADFTVNADSGIADTIANLPRFTLSPSPANDKINVTFDAPIPNISSITPQIYSFTGEQMPAKCMYSSYNWNIEISTAEYAPGVYILYINDLPPVSFVVIK